MTLDVLNPRGALAPPPVVPPTAGIADLSAAKIGVYWNGKAGADNLLSVIGDLLKGRFPASTIVRYDGPLDIGDDRATAMSSKVDAFIYGVGD